MIVRQDDAGAAVLGRVAMISRSGKSGSGFVAVVARQMEAARLVVDVGDPQAFARGIGVREAAGKDSRAAARPSSFSGSSAR